MHAPLVPKSYQIKKGCQHIFCDKTCYGLFQRQRIQRVCEICQKSFEILQSQIKNGGGRTCSRKCHHAYQATRQYVSGKQHHLWGDGTTIINGYRVVKNATHPFCLSTGYVYEHRLVLEPIIGRYLLSTEDVHHVDKNRLNNSVNNLMLFKSRSAHRKFESGKTEINTDEIIFDGRAYKLNATHPK